MSKTVLTIILNYRTADMTFSAAEAAMRAMADISGDIVIVDNDSQDGSFERLSQKVADAGWSRVRVLQSGRNGGFGAGNNFGIRAGLSDGSAPDYVYILNSDAFPAEDAIRKLLDYLETHRDVDFAGSYIHGPDGDPHNTCFRFPSIASEFESAARTGPISRLLKKHIVALDVPETSGRVDWLAGASVMMRQQTLDRIGLFDETFFLYFEETDLCRRLARAGGCVHFVRESAVAHIGSVSTGMKSWDRVPGYWFQSRWHYFVKNHGTGYAVLATLARITGTLISRLRRMIGSKPQVEPDVFLRDLTAHFVKSMIRSRSVPPTPAPLVRPFAEDNK